MIFTYNTMPAILYSRCSIRSSNYPPWQDTIVMPRPRLFHYYSTTLPNQSINQSLDGYIFTRHRYFYCGRRMEKGRHGEYIHWCGRVRPEKAQAECLQDCTVSPKSTEQWCDCGANEFSLRTKSNNQSGGHRSGDGDFNMIWTTKAESIVLYIMAWRGVGGRSLRQYNHAYRARRKKINCNILFSVRYQHNRFRSLLNCSHRRQNQSNFKF